MTEFFPTSLLLWGSKRGFTTMVAGESSSCDSLITLPRILPKEIQFRMCVSSFVYRHVNGPRFFFPQTVWLTLRVLTVRVKGRVARSRWRTESVAIFVVSCLHVRFVCEFSWFRLGSGSRGQVLYVNFRSFRLFNVVILALFVGLRCS